MWIKQSDPTNSFHVAMGACDNADVCNLIGLYILDSLRRTFPPVFFGLYSDDALVISREASGHTLNSLRKDLISILGSTRLKITIKTNLTTADFLDVTLDCRLQYQQALPQTKTRGLIFINTISCHPPIMFKNLAKGVSRVFRAFLLTKRPSTPYCNAALTTSEVKDHLSYRPKPNTRRR